MDEYIKNAEPFLATLAQLFVLDGKAREVAILANSEGRFEQTDYDNWNGGMYGYTLILQTSVAIYAQIKEQLDEVQKQIEEKTQPLFAAFPKEYLHRVTIIPRIESSNDWRERANVWVTGKGVTNQGRVRSDNIASRTCDGLLFRSEPEINLYKALKSLGVSFAPLPVFIRGGKDYRRIEPDFVIVKDGIMMVVEVDGDTVHTETPAEAHARTTMLGHEGVYIERVRAAECVTLDAAQRCAQNLLQAISRHKANR